MMPQMLAARGLSMRSPADGIHYFNAHLMNTEEAGVFLDFPGYLDDQDHVVPLIWNVALWHLVGLDACTEQIPDKLISQLCQGMDLHGNQLIDTAMFSPPLEVILTIHCEVSEAMETHPNVGRQMLHAMVRAVLADIEQNAWLVGDGRGGREWRPGHVLAVAFIHARNQENEPHLHAHVIVFPMVFVSSTAWHPYYERAFFRRLNTEDGIRSRIGAVAREEAAKHGFIIEYADGPASKTLLNGATVTCPSGRVIPAGSIPRKRMAGILARKLLKEALGVQPLTPKEAEIVKMNPGVAPYRISGLRNPDRLTRKLKAMGILDPNGLVLPKEALVLVIRKVDAAMLKAQVSVPDLCALPLKQAVAVGKAIGSERQILSRLIPGFATQDTMRVATIRWTKSFISVVQRVSDSAAEGLPLDGLNDCDGDMLIKLIRAGLITIEAMNKRRVFRITAFGELKLAVVRARVEYASNLRYSILHHMPQPDPHLNPPRKEIPRYKPINAIAHHSLEVETRNGPTKIHKSI